MVTRPIPDTLQYYKLETYILHKCKNLGQCGQHRSGKTEIKLEGKKNLDLEPPNNRDKDVHVLGEVKAREATVKQCKLMRIEERCSTSQAHAHPVSRVLGNSI